MTDSQTIDRRFDRLSTLLGGYELTQMLAVFSELGVPEALARSPRTAVQLADELDCHPRALYRLLRALSGAHVVSVDDHGSFSLTRVGARLLRDADDSLRPLAVCYGQTWWWAAWGDLLHSVRTGETAFDHVHGRSLYEYLEGDEDASSIFAGCMTARGMGDASGVVEAFDFSTAGSVVDVGGGVGELIELILNAYAGVTATLFDTPTTIEAARAQLADSPVRDRLELRSGDFFASVPSGADLYVLKNILHNWDDEDAVAILSSVRDAVSTSGRLLVVQHIVPDDNRPSPAKLLDMALLVLTGGEQRTETEYRRLLDSAGFEVTRVIPTASGISLVEARPIARGGR
jgi:hypothetical protein